VRRRIVGLAVLAAILAIGLFGLPLAVAVARYAVLEEESNLVRLAEAASVTVASDLNDGDTPTIPPTHSDTRLAVYDHHGSLLVGAGPPRDQLVDQALDGKIATGIPGDDVVVAVAVTHATDVIGSVRAASPRSQVVDEVGIVWLGMAALAAMAVAVVWLLARRQARRLARPLEQLSEAARRLGEGDFSVRSASGGIREIDAVGMALSRTAARLDDMLARERAFSADASHQLRTPLAGLRLRLEAGLRRDADDLRKAVTSGLDEADRLERTIGELLELARDTRRGDGGPLDVSALMAEIRRTWNERLSNAGRGLVIEADPQPPESAASASAARQVLNVLLDNAVTHGAGTVTVRVRDATGALALDVLDEGAALTIPESVLFARRTNAMTGHGIGLALARRLAEAEGGRLALSCADPPTFTMLLPARAEQISARTEGRS
jgi:signal transduction histidine kinase